MANQTLFTMVGYALLTAFVPTSMLLLLLRPAWCQRLMLLFFGLFVAQIAPRTDDPQLVVVLLLGMGFLAGFAQPHQRWVATLMLAGPTPLLAGIGVGIGALGASSTTALSSLFVFLPALTGTCFGALLSRWRQPNQVKGEVAS